MKRSQASGVKDIKAIVQANCNKKQLDKLLEQKQEEASKLISESLKRVEEYTKQLQEPTQPAKDAKEEKARQLKLQGQKEMLKKSCG